MVVSEMGEQWSPKVAPARTAATPTNIRLGSRAATRGTTMGIMIPMVPQEVPVAKEIREETIKMVAGTAQRGKFPSMMLVT